MIFMGVKGEEEAKDEPQDIAVVVVAAAAAFRMERNEKSVGGSSLGQGRPSIRRCGNWDDVSSHCVVCSCYADSRYLLGSCAYYVHSRLGILTHAYCNRRAAA